MYILRLIRFPNLLILASSQYLAGVYLMHVSHQEKVLFLIILSFTLMAAAGYILNDYYDLKTDKINKPQRVIITHSVSKKSALIGTTFCSILSIDISFEISFLMGIFCMGYIGMLWWYSFFLKRTPFWGNLCIATLSGGSIFILSVYYKVSTFTIYLFSLFSFFISLIRELIKDIEDIKGDSACSYKTLPIIWDIKKIKMVLYILIGTFLVLIGIAIAYFQIKEIKIYFILLSLFMMYFIFYVYKAHLQKDFHRLSFFSKLIIMSGILAMFLFD